MDQTLINWLLGAFGALLKFPQERCLTLGSDFKQHWTNPEWSIVANAAGTASGSAAGATAKKGRK